MHAIDRCWRLIGFTKLFATAQAVIIFGEMLPNEIGLQFLERLKAERDATGPQIAAVDALICSFIEGIALPLRPFSRDTQVNAIIDDRNIEHPLKAALVIIA